MSGREQNPAPSRCVCPGQVRFAVTRDPHADADAWPPTVCASTTPQGLASDALRCLDPADPVEMLRAIAGAIGVSGDTPIDNAATRVEAVAVLIATYLAEEARRGPGW